jgi:hypothetical protein
MELRVASSRLVDLEGDDLVQLRLAQLITTMTRRAAGVA